MTDHIFLQIQSYDSYVIFFQFMQIIIHGKCEIRFTTAKIQDCKFSSLIKLRQYILDKFQEPVDLPEFVEFRMHDLSILCHNTKILKKWYRDSLFQHILFLTVMAHINLLFPALFYLTFYSHFSFFTYKYCCLASGTGDLSLTERTI